MYRINDTPLTQVHNIAIVYGRMIFAKIWGPMQRYVRFSHATEGASSLRWQRERMFEEKESSRG